MTKVFGSRRARALLATTMLGAALVVSAPSFAADAAPEWHPDSSERLVKLPATYLKKSLERDFAESALGNALRGTDDEVGGKAKTLADLQSAVAKADGETRIELRHRFLYEKRAYVDLMSRRNDLQRKHVAIQTRLLEDMLARMRPDAGSESPAHRELIKRQDAARARFESSLSTVDMALFNSSSAPESKYAAKYAENSAAIEKLVARIQTHKMNELTVADGESMSKEDYVRQMLADAHAEAALIDQEDTILGYMARLVALDAMALADEALDPNSADAETPARSAPAAIAPLFISN
jgi:hypothetical protein